MNRAIATWWSRARQPAPDSVLGLALAQGRPAWGELIHVMWSVWVFVVPMFSPYGYDLRWALLTLLSYPVFLALFYPIAWLTLLVLLAALPAILIVWTYRNPRELIVALGLCTLTTNAYAGFLFWAFVG